MTLMKHEHQHSLRRLLEYIMDHQSSERIIPYDEVGTAAPDDEGEDDYDDDSITSLVKALLAENNKEYRPWPEKTMPGANAAQ